jgi:uncharacterized protein YbcI
MPHEQSRPVSDRGAIAAEISREIVRLHANLYGRGPTKAKTYVTDTYILCLLEDVFTPAERTLVDAGSAEQVWSTRRAFQEAVADKFIAIVESASDRSVRAFMSQVSIEPDLSAEIFVLEPLPEQAREEAGPGGGVGADGADGGAPEADA